MVTWRSSAAELPDIRRRCAAFDRQVLQDAQRAGGPAYRDLCALAFPVCAAALAESPGQFRAFIEPVHRWLQETPSRVPLSDLYRTDTGCISIARDAGPARICAR